MTDKGSVQSQPADGNEISLFAIEFNNILQYYQKEEVKIWMHDKFQTVCSRFWVILKKDDSGRITKQEYSSVCSNCLISLANEKNI